MQEAPSRRNVPPNSQTRLPALIFPHLQETSTKRSGALRSLKSQSVFLWRLKIDPNSRSSLPADLAIPASFHGEVWSYVRLLLSIPLVQLRRLIAQIRAVLASAPAPAPLRFGD